MSDVKRYDAGNLTAGEVVMAADYDALAAAHEQAWKSATSESHAWAREYEARMLVEAERDQLRAEVEKRQLTIDGMNEKHWELVQAHAQLRAELEAIRGRKPSLDKWAEYKAKFCGCKDASRHNSCRGLATCQLPIGHPERKGEALPPQQPDAVSVPRELEALQAECDNLRISLKDADHGMVLFMQQRDELLQELESIKRRGQVIVPEDLLKRALRADASKGAGPAQLLDGWAAMDELRALLSTKNAEEV